MREKLNISNADNIVFQRSHRLAGKKRPAPIICRFLLFTDTAKVWSAKTILNGTDYFIREDFPSEFLSRRRVLYPIMKRAREQGRKAYLDRDVLVIDKNRYDVNSIHTLPENLQPASLATRSCDNVTAFFTASTPLSNFYKVDLKIDGKSFHSVEQYFQYEKALHAECPDQAQRILHSERPATCKSIGDKIQVNDG